MLKYSINNIISRKQALYVISRFGIPRDLRNEIIGLMIEDGFLKDKTNFKIEIINSKKIQDFNKNLNEIIWTSLMQEIEENRKV